MRISNKANLTVIGDSAARVSDGPYNRRAGIAVSNSAGIEISGFHVSKSLWGITVQDSQNVFLHHLTVTDVGQEGIHINRYSTGVTVADSSISHTGQRGGIYERYGEGIYLGTGSGLVDDDTNNIVLTRNDISYTTSEAIDVKPMVYNVLVEQNNIHDIDTNTSGAVVVGIGVRSYRDPNTTIRGNIIWNISANSGYSDGNAISLSASATVEANIIWSTEHFGILMDGNFVSPERSVDLNHNAVFSTGSDAIKQWSSSTPAEPTLVGNLTSGDVSGSVSSDPLTNGQPSTGVLNLRNSLLSAVGAPTPSPTPVTAPTPTTTPTPTPTPTSAPAANPTTTAQEPSATETQPLGTQPIATQPLTTQPVPTQPLTGQPSSTSVPSGTVSTPTAPASSPLNDQPSTSVVGQAVTTTSGSTGDTTESASLDRNGTSVEIARAESSVAPPRQAADESSAVEPTGAALHADLDGPPPSQLAFADEAHGLMPTATIPHSDPPISPRVLFASLIIICAGAVVLRARAPHEPLA